MKVKKIKVRNFRLLKDFEIDLEDNLSLAIGKIILEKLLYCLFRKFNSTNKPINIDMIKRMVLI